MADVHDKMSQGSKPTYRPPFWISALTGLIAYGGKAGIAGGAGLGIVAGHAASYLQDRWRRPFAWLWAYGSVGAVGGAIAGAQQEGLQGAWLGAFVLGAFVAGVVGLIVGTAAGTLVWLG